MNCESCGMPMMKPEDHGAGKEDNKYCKYCTDEEGKLKSREQVKEGMMQLKMNSEKKSIEQAEREVEEYMKSMPAWKDD